LLESFLWFTAARYRSIEWRERYTLYIYTGKLPFFFYMHFIWRSFEFTSFSISQFQVDSCVPNLGCISYSYIIIVLIPTRNILCKYVLFKPLSYININGMWHWVWSYYDTQNIFIYDSATIKVSHINYDKILHKLFPSLLFFKGGVVQFLNIVVRNQDLLTVKFIQLQMQYPTLWHKSRTYYLWVTYSKI